MLKFQKKKKYYLKEEYNVEKKKLIIGGVILGVLVVGGTIFALNKGKSNKQEVAKVETSNNNVISEQNDENKGLSDEELKRNTIF